MSPTLISFQSTIVRQIAFTIPSMAAILQHVSSLSHLCPSSHCSLPTAFAIH